MSEQHIQGYGSSLEIYYTVIDKSDIQTKNDLCRLYIENLVEFGSNSETYFSTVEYQNDDFEEGS